MGRGWIVRDGGRGGWRRVMMRYFNLDEIIGAKWKYMACKFVNMETYLYLCLISWKSISIDRCNDISILYSL